MIRSSGLWALPCLMLGSPLWASQTKDVYEIRGRVLDEAGKAVSGIRIGTGWNFDGGKPRARWRSGVTAKPGTSLLTDAEGRFSGKLYARRPAVAIFALDADKELGGILIFAKKEIKAEYTLRIGPLVHLRGKLELPSRKGEVQTSYIYLTDKRARIAIGSYVSSKREFAFLVPPGEYDISFSAKDVKKVTMGVRLEAKDKRLDLGTISLLPTNLARHYGKAPPSWNITEARGVRPDIKLSDYRGKWVLIEWWAWW